MGRTGAQRPPRAPAANRSPLLALRERPLAIYSIGNLASNCGTWFQSIASVILVDHLSHGNTVLVGLVVFSQFAAVVALAPWAGRAVDHFDRKRLMILTQLGAAAVSASLAVLQVQGLVTVPVLIAMTVLLGVTTAFAAPGLKAVVVALVPDELVGDAVALDSATFNLARVVGPVLGAVVYAAWGPAWSFSLNSLSYLVLVAALASLSPRRNRRPTGPAGLRQSIALVAADTRLIGYFVVIAAVAFSTDPANTLGPALARSFGHPAAAAGWLLGALGAGATLAAFTLSPRRSGASRRLVVESSMVGVGTVAVAVSPGLGVAMIALCVVGFGYLAAQTQATTMLQLEVADDQRGRIMALWSVAFLGTRPIAALIDGGLARAFGARPATAIMAIPAFLAAAWVARAERARVALEPGPADPVRNRRR